MKSRASLICFVLTSVSGRTAPSVTLVFVTRERCTCKNRRGKYRFPISGVNRDIFNSIINTGISN